MAGRTGSDATPLTDAFHEADREQRAAAGLALRSGESRGRRWPAVLAVLVVLVLVAGVGGAAYRLGWGGFDDRVDGWVDALGGGPDETPTDDPAAVAPPEGLDVPAVRVPDPVAASSERTTRLDAGAVRDAIGPELSVRPLGPHVLAAVAPLDGGDGVRLGGSGTATPASTTKVVTSTAALYSLGPEHTFHTDVVRAGSDGGVPRLVLVGGGDPFLSSTPYPGDPDEPTVDPPRADVETLAARTAASLRKQGVRRVSLGYDASLFSGPSVNPTWEPDYVPGELAPISALWVDEGRDASGYTHVSDPPLVAAQAYAAALDDAGVTVVGAPTADDAPTKAERVARVTSPPLSAIVERLLNVSDNAAAEILLRQVGLSQEGEGSFEGGQRGVERVLRSNGVDMGRSVLHDGSGLSRANRLDPEVLVDVLRLAASDQEPDLRPVLTGLPVAGYTGSLDDRMGGGPADGLGRTRAKTGTLTGVTSLAGLAIEPDGGVLVFALMADRVRDAQFGLAETAMDSAAGALGACDCSS